MCVYQVLPMYSNLLVDSCGLLSVAFYLLYFYIFIYLPYLYFYLFSQLQCIVPYNSCKWVFLCGWQAEEIWLNILVSFPEIKLLPSDNLLLDIVFCSIIAWFFLKGEITFSSVLIFA
ncbi:Hypothetical predicted protein [Podarcis lilfordi]|uniref:Uncharacterized protein n=1 Tax=Podarcis lilfordi TaxID=74358 RepID=A0AA35P265_9SAUR|nr:Hypothetical predicted protein [Podarcis lilfordi]